MHTAFPAGRRDRMREGAADKLILGNWVGVAFVQGKEFEVAGGFSACLRKEVGSGVC